MLQEKDITIKLKCQQYICETYMRDMEEERSVLIFESQQQTEETHCPLCNGRVNISGQTQKSLKDIPIWSGVEQELCFLCHRYRCTECGRKFTEDIPLQHPGTRITQRAACWVQAMLRNKLSVRSVQNLTGIHWETIRRIQSEMMTCALEAHTQALKNNDYHPQYLAVDEFAIHKGHTYATCVMDVESGEVLWVGKGRSKADFARFFAEVEPSFLTAVKAVAMDMNASYYLLVAEKLPQAAIVYDCYHMQEQFGREVLGTVRLEEARKHKEHSVALKAELSNLAGEAKKNAQEELKQEKMRYSQVKKLRWTLLSNGEKLSEEQHAHLDSILDKHSSLAVCYAMKEELCRLFSLRDPLVAEAAWRNWFSAAKESGIPALVRFAVLKEKRLNGLIAHASFPISTGKLEGFNNKIKVAKRVGYGYRDDTFFFLLVRFLSLAA